MKKILYAGLLTLLFAGCSSIPDVPYPLANTSWEYVNRDENDNRYVVEYTQDTVTFTIFKKDGSVFQEPISGTYTLSGTELSEAYDDFFIIMEYTGSQIKDLHDSRMVYTQQ